MSEDHVHPTREIQQSLPKLLDQPPILAPNSILSNSEAEKLKRLAEKAKLQHEESDNDAMFPPDSFPASVNRQESYSTETSKYFNGGNKFDSYNLDGDYNDDDGEESKRGDNNNNNNNKSPKHKLKKRNSDIEEEKGGEDDDDDDDDEDDDDGDDGHETASDSGEEGAVGAGRSSRKSDESHLTEPPVEGGFIHAGWSYQAYCDRLERLERYPIEVFRFFILADFCGFYFNICSSISHKYNVCEYVSFLNMHYILFK
jgi:hypothetical protein